MTSSAGFLMAPVAFSSAAVAPLVAVSAGTALAACSANTFNQAWEIENDKLMKRTQNRPLPSGRISRNHALAFGGAMGVAGTTLLATACNPLTAALGAANIGLYALVYTPMKVRSEWNTWAGSVVGAIPPLMGYAAAAGDCLAPGAALAAGTLFLWQFPHFFALAWRLRRDYARGGFKMVPVADPTGSRTADLVYRYSLYMLPLPVLAAAGDVTSWMFALEGTALNAYLIHLARGFKQERTTGRSKKVFMCTLWYLPLLLSLMVFHKKKKPQVDGDSNGDNVSEEAPPQDGGEYGEGGDAGTAERVSSSFCARYDDDEEDFDGPMLGGDYLPLVKQFEKAGHTDPSLLELHKHLDFNPNLEGEMLHLPGMHYEIDWAEDEEESERLGELEEHGEVTSFVVKVNRVIKGGITMRFNALVVCGNMRGTAGFGVGKGKQAKHAINLAYLKAQRNLMHVELRDGQRLYHDVEGRHGATNVSLHALPNGKGTHVSDTVRTVLESLGITDCGGKVHGSRNKFNVIQATFNALTKHRSAEEMAFARGTRLIDLAKQT
eukprot:g1804.t1